MKDNIFAGRNLLAKDNFEDIRNWARAGRDYRDVDISNPFAMGEGESKERLLCLRCADKNCAHNGVYQLTDMLSIGKYAFTVSLRVDNDFIETDEGGGYILVCSYDGKPLAESKYISKANSEFEKITVSFALREPQQLRVFILLDGRGTVFANSVKLEKIY